MGRLNMKASVWTDNDIDKGLWSMTLADAGLCTKHGRIFKGQGFNFLSSILNPFFCHTEGFSRGTQLTSGFPGLCVFGVVHEKRVQWCFTSPPQDVMFAAGVFMCLVIAFLFFHVGKFSFDFFNGRKLTLEIIWNPGQKFIV